MNRRGLDDLSRGKQVKGTENSKSRTRTKQEGRTQRHEAIYIAAGGSRREARLRAVLTKMKGFCPPRIYDSQDPCGLAQFFVNLFRRQSLCSFHVRKRQVKSEETDHGCS